MAAVLLAALAIAVAMATLAGTSLAAAAGAMIAVYAFGYVTGSLLVDPADGATLSFAVVRTIAGLFLATIGFLLSLVLSLPWFAGPAALFGLAAVLHRRAAFGVPRLDLSSSWDGAAAGLLVLLAIAPVLIASMRMAPGEFPPVFFNVDTAYFLEKVHALVKTDVFPPESLGVVGGRPPYHLGVHGVAALISRSSGLAPHHSLFLVVLPLLAVGAIAAAVFLARSIGPTLPWLVALPILLASAPTLWYPFWNSLGPAVRDAVSSRFDSLAALAANYEFWGVASNNGQNVAAQFLVLASLAGIAAAPSCGWRLPVFLIGTAVLFKAPTGVALIAGFSIAQGFRALMARSARPLVPAVAAIAVYGAIYGTFWMLPPGPVEYTTELAPLFHIEHLDKRDQLLGFFIDVTWLLLPGLILLPITIRNRESASLPLLLFAAAPFAIVNLLNGVDLRASRGYDGDWFQIMLPVPLLIHVWVLSVVAHGWARLAASVRAVVVLVMVLGVLPPLGVAAKYAHVLSTTPERGHEFVDNRALATALAAIPTENTIVVTNDLRYPADGFSRAHRQMQIPALFGHQAFAVNYAYESYPFSADRMELQDLLQQREWTGAIEQAARTHGWTHLLVRKDYVHPAPIPLELVYDSDLYSVFRFPVD